jgi:hypothetical protein
MSTRYTLNRSDLTSIAKGLGIAVAGAILTYVSSIITDIDFGQYTPLVVVVWSVVANVARKFLSE